MQFPITYVNWNKVIIDYETVCYLNPDFKNIINYLPSFYYSL